MHAVPDARWMQSSTRRWNGSTGSVIVGCSSRSATYPQRSLNTSTIVNNRVLRWSPDSNPGASGFSGAVQSCHGFEGSDRSLLGDRGIDALSELAPRLLGALSGPSEGHVRINAKSKGLSPATESVIKAPVAAAVRHHAQVQPIRVSKFPRSLRWLRAANPAVSQHDGISCSRRFRYRQKYRHRIETCREPKRRREKQIP